MQFSTYLFDFDGTLCDTRVSLVPVFRAGFASVGREVTEEECARWMHLNLGQTLADSGIPERDYQTVTDATIAALDLPESLELIQAFPDAFTSLRRLKRQGKRIGIVSNNTSSHIRLVLNRLGCDVPFDCIVGSDMFAKGKPSPDPVLTALVLLGEDPSRKVCYIGDSLQDPECGINAGIAGVLLDREDGHSDYSGLKIRSLEELFS